MSFQPTTGTAVNVLSSPGGSIVWTGSVTEANPGGLPDHFKVNLPSVGNWAIIPLSLLAPAS